MGNKFIEGFIHVNNSAIAVVSTKLRLNDYLGAVMVRWGINRNKYRVEPGLYSIGKPNNSSDVFVSANYKLSFDSLRKNLDGLDGWILVLDTRGVNVWCAAGKGTFGTKELVTRINDVSLENLVDHRRIIVPQLGATGVAAHRVKQESGFNVLFGPVRAADIKSFIKAGYKASNEMRKVTFNFGERIKLIPNDFVYSRYYLLGALALVYFVSMIKNDGFHFSISDKHGITSMFNVLLAYCAGVVLTPALLPYLPFRRFALKGFVSGIILSIILFFMNMLGSNIFENISWFLLITAVSSFLAMNFTGSSTYTSLSGVRKEMKTAVPLQIGFAVTGIALMIISKMI